MHTHLQNLVTSWINGVKMRVVLVECCQDIPTAAALQRGMDAVDFELSKLVVRLSAYAAIISYSHRRQLELLRDSGRDF